MTWITADVFGASKSTRQVRRIRAAEFFFFVREPSEVDNGTSFPLVDTTADLVLKLASDQLDELGDDDGEGEKAACSFFGGAGGTRCRRCGRVRGGELGR